MPMLKVLIIDDSDTDRFLYRHYLENSTQPYEVYEAADGETGITLAERFNPDCILLDLNLMEQSGYEVLAHLVGLERPPKRSVIILTGLGQDILREGALALGAAGFLLKNHTDAAALDLAIRKVIAQTPDAG
jgi:DNA-binding NarL/FixJ family response regulator